MEELIKDLREEEEKHLIIGRDFNTRTREERGPIGGRKKEEKNKVKG